MKIATIIGARPQFIKAAAVSKELKKENKEILIHTGQHYDANMSDVFFEELDIPKPSYHLKTGSGTHAQQTASMLIGIEDILLKEKPEYVLVYGDTNSTLAGALAASKILIPIIHVEAGLRSYNKCMPEEQNRILTDHMSQVLFCPTQHAVENLKKEGISKNVFYNGDVMCDAVLHFGQKVTDTSLHKMKKKLICLFEEKKEFDAWYLASVHRAENTDELKKLEDILEAFEQLDEKVLFSVHPRTQKILIEILEKRKYTNIIFVEPMGYLEMLYFTKNAKKVITDSGGLQKEAYLLNTRCVTLREQTEWIETLENNWNVLATLSVQDIIEKVSKSEKIELSKRNIFGEGNAAKIMCEQLKQV